MAEYLRFNGQRDEWEVYGHAMVDVYGPRGTYLGRAFRFDEKKRPKIGDPVKCWGGETHYITWVRAHYRRWRVRTEDGELRTVVEFPTSFLWSQIA